MNKLSVDDLRKFFRNLFEEVPGNGLLAKGYREQLAAQSIKENDAFVATLLEWLSEVLPKAIEEDDSQAKIEASTLARIVYNRGDLLNDPGKETYTLETLIKLLN